MEKKAIRRKRVPKAPDFLLNAAKEKYNNLYKILIDEDRGKEKYRATVAMAANALYFYEKAMELAEGQEELMGEDPGLHNQVLTGISKASMEWNRTAKALLLTPESEVKLAMPEEDDGPSFFDMIGGPKSRNENYSTKPERSKKDAEKRARKHK